MNVKKIIWILLTVLMISLLVTAGILFKIPKQEFDIVAANDIIETLSKHWEDLNQGDDSSIAARSQMYKLQYTVLDLNGEVLATTGGGVSKNLNTAIRHRDIIVDVIVNKEIVGKVIFYNDFHDVMQKQRKGLLVSVLITFILLAVICSGYVYYLNRVLFTPFNRLQEFAKNIAGGNLDFTLEMDEYNLFGAFTESFDIMREELKRAQENEKLADKSKKELVASLSHDIKTPIASIKSVADIVFVKSNDEWIKRQMEILNIKSDQIDLLISNMFHATLEELNELKVSVMGLESVELYRLIQNSDIQNRVEAFVIPECFILADTLRLQQVFDNVINNSYKYADTKIQITSYFIESFLVVELMDFGAGVKKGELPLVFEKFYRGQNADSKHGSGLGLYISMYLMRKMQGDIECFNCEKGFVVRLFLLLEK